MANRGMWDRGEMGVLMLQIVSMRRTILVVPPAYGLFMTDEFTVPYLAKYQRLLSSKESLKCSVCKKPLRNYASVRMSKSYSMSHV